MGRSKFGACGEVAFDVATRLGWIGMDYIGPWTLLTLARREILCVLRR